MRKGGRSAETDNRVTRRDIGTGNMQKLRDGERKEDETELYKLWRRT